MHTPQPTHREPPPPRRPRRALRSASRRAAGVTLTESAVVLGIVAILLGAAVPGLGELRLRRQMEGIAAQLETDIQLARSEAVARNQSVHIGFAADETGSCYLLHTGASGDCRCDGHGATVCHVGAEMLRSVPLGAAAPVQLSSNSASILFDAEKGTVTPTASMRVHARIGEIRQIVNVMGRVRSCSPDGMPGYRPC
ncbi:MAG: GspH/FimT family pseudopilin [Burkholderiales bacterium]|nr:GspH/FimT family pseudopilin [Burkholderiales bacterium]